MSSNIKDKIEIHNNRGIFEISGIDRKKFIQGLITNDINKLNDDLSIIYAAMLNNQGRFLYDFFIFEKNEKLIFDCPKEKIDEIIKKLNLYKLRSKVEILKNENLLSGFSQNKLEEEILQFIDPRSNKLGYRVYFEKNSSIEIINQKNYDFLRIQNKIPEGLKDLTYEKSLILEFDFDNLNAIDYKKGCYIGQELTSRTHFRGEIRKKIFQIKIPQKIKFEKNDEITCEGKPVGIVLSSTIFESEIYALALIKNPDDLSGFYKNLMLKNIEIFIIN